MTFRLSLVALGLASWLTASSVAADDRVEVLARGPVHEAYAEPSEREPAPTPIIPREPPKLIEELPPDQKPDGDNVQWMPGYWQWDEDKKDFVWVSGFWRNAPPGRIWVPGSWRQAGDGWQWSGGFWATPQDGGRAQVEYLPQPPAPLDVEGPVTPAPSENHVYSPGCWVFRERYVWRPGYWYEYQPGYVWINAHYRWTPAGYVFIDGYWDYPLADRGVLFAPVYIPPAVYTAPAFVYTPSYVVREDCLFGAFFARRGFGAYYFGDYFAPTYASLGFTAWVGNVGVSLSIGRGWYDPLFSYYQVGFRSDPFWGGGGVFDLYAGRYRGDYLRPPVNLVQQNTVINNITNVTNVTNVNTNNVTMLTSLNNADRGGRRRLTRVPEAERQQFLASAGSTRELAARRAQGEAQLAARPGAGGKTAAPRSLTLEPPPAPKGAGRPTGVDPKVAAGGPLRPTTTAASAPPPPKPSPIGRLNARGPNLAAPPKGGDPTAVAGPPASRPNLKPPVAAKAGVAAPKGDPVARPGVLPKVTGAAALPKVDQPPAKAGPSLPPRPAAKADLPLPKSVPGPAARPSAVKPPPSAPPVTIPKPAPSAPALPRISSSPAPKMSAPPASALPRPSASPAVPRINTPPASIPRPSASPALPRISSPPASVPRPSTGPAIPRMSSPPAAPRISAPAPAVSRPAPAPARPAAPPARPSPPPKKGKG